MKKRTYLMPMIALTAFSTAAMAKVGVEVPNSVDRRPSDETTSPTITRAFKDAIEQSLVLYRKGGDLFSYTLEQQPDGTVLAAHYSHRSHSSHSSHASHRSHTSSRW